MGKYGEREWMENRKADTKIAIGSSFSGKNNNNKVDYYEWMASQNIVHFNHMPIILFNHHHRLRTFYPYVHSREYKDC